MFIPEEFWKMTDPDRIVSLIREVKCWRLGNWDGCCCSSFDIRNVSVDISCGKGREQAVWVSSQSLDYYSSDDPDFAAKKLTPVMDEVIRQLAEHSGRGGSFTRYFKPYSSERRSGEQS